MKKILFLVVVLLVVCIKTNAQAVIEKIENGIGVITIDETILKAKWEKYLSSTGIIDANLSEFQIKKVSNEKYFIVSKDNTVRKGLTSSYGIELITNGLMFSSGNNACTCTGSNGCNMGCQPEKLSNGSWYCTFCVDPQAICDKTESAAGSPVIR